MTGSGPQYESRTGLVYELEYYDDVAVYTYQAAAVFFVDGIRYDPHHHPDCRRPMVEVHDDVPNLSHYARMDHTEPPTQADLDDWMHKVSVSLQW